MQHAKAFVFAVEEDFGITLVEAQACGTPVIAYGKGGALETIKENDTGIFFVEQNAESIIETVMRFENIESITAKSCRLNAEKFSIENFVGNMKEYIQKCIDK